MADPKTEKDLNLADQCIAHWERMRDNPGTDEQPNSDNCAFCNEYVDEASDTTDACAGCPISAHTGRGYCSGTPYSTASLIYQLWLADHMNAERNETSTDPELADEWREAAQAEIDFLRTLKESIGGK